MTTKYQERSGESDFYLKHMEAMGPANSMEVGQSFTLPVDGPDLDLLKGIAKVMSVGKKAIAVIERETCIEVERFPDGTDVKLFYQHHKPEFARTIAEREGVCKSEVKRVINEYFDNPVEKSIKYDKALNDTTLANGIVSRAYIQRRVSSLAPFRKRKLATHETIESLVEDGYLTELSEEGATFYKVNK